MNALQCQRLADLEPLLMTLYLRCRLIVWPLRVAWFLILLGACYFVGTNLVLNLPATQGLVNGIDPARLQINWDRARSLWPLTIRLQGVRGRGEVGAQNWSFTASAIATSIDVAGLLDRQVRIDSAEVRDPAFSLAQDPALDEGASPESEDSSPSAPVEAETRSSWVVDVELVEVSGDIGFSVPKLQGKLQGRLATGLRYDTGTTEFSLHDGVVDSRGINLRMDGDGRLMDRGQLDGRFRIEPFVVRSHPGKKMLRFLEVDAELSFDTGNLRFLEPWLKRFPDMEISGSGSVEGDIRIDEGRFRPGSKLVVDAPELAMNLFDFGVAGQGELVLDVADASPEQMDATVLFRQLKGYDREREALLIKGDNLRVSAVAPTALVIDKKSVMEGGSLKLSVEQVVVPDIAAYQRFVPTSLPLALKQGVGRLSAELVLDQQHFDSRIILSSQASVAGFREFEVESGLEIVLQVSVDSFAESTVDLGGTAIRFSNTRIDQQDQADSDEFATSLEIDRGQLQLDENRFGEGAARWRQFMKEQDVDAMLSNADADLHVVGKVSSLEWINSLIDNPYGLEVEGGGTMDISLLLNDGTIGSGSLLEVSPENLLVTVLDYAVAGRGNVKLSMEGDASEPDIGLRLEVLDGSFGRRDETTSFVEVDQFLIEANASSVGVDTLTASPDSDMHLRIIMPAARVTDMAVYNSYLPDTSPLQFTGGSAVLSVDVALEPSSAEGKVILQSDGLGATIDDQQVSADLSVNLKIVGGTPADMQFDVSGSSIVIDQVRVDGDAAAFGSEDGESEPWNVTLGLDHARVRWKKPLEIDSELSLRMKDTLPMVAVFANNRGESGWLEKLLTVEDVRGTATLLVRDQRISIPYLMVEADNIQLGAKAAFEGNKRAGVVYARYKKLNGLLEFAGAKRNFDILKARKQFDQYDVSSAELVAVPSSPDTAKSDRARQPETRTRGDKRSDQGPIRNTRPDRDPPIRAESASRLNQRQPSQENAR